LVGRNQPIICPAADLDAGFFFGYSRDPGITDNAIPVGAGWLAMDSSAPRLSSPHALSLTTIASKPAPTEEGVHHKQRGRALDSELICNLTITPDRRS
jgi:hypothetical protein